MEIKAPKIKRRTWWNRDAKLTNGDLIIVVVIANIISIIIYIL